MTFITTTEELFKICKPLYEESYITIDTEFIRESTFWPELCLIQIAGSQGAYAIDPLSEELSLDPLFDLLVHPGTLKVFHAARQDIEIIYHLTNQLPFPLFDTQIAAMVCGFGESASYETLVHHLTQKKLDKSQRFTDWKHRPLTPKQLNYALGDVIYLREVYEKLAKRLHRNGRESWLKEEMDELSNPENYKPHPQNAWLKLRPKKTTPLSLCILRELAAWREIEARAQNVPRRQVVGDDILVELAALKPHSVEDLKLSRAFPKQFYKTPLAETLVLLIESARSIPDENWPVITRNHEGVEYGSAALEMLKLALKLIAEEEGVATKLIATTDDLKRLIRKQYKDENDLSLLHGWRYDIFGQKAIGLLEGQYALSLKKNQLKLIEVPQPNAVPDE